MTRGRGADEGEEEGRREQGEMAIRKGGGGEREKERRRMGRETGTGRRCRRRNSLKIRNRGIKIKIDDGRDKEKRGSVRDV